MYYNLYHTFALLCITYILTIIMLFVYSFFVIIYKSANNVSQYAVYAFLMYTCIKELNFMECYTSEE